MRRRLGVDFVDRAEGGLDQRRTVRGVAGVPIGLIKGFSKRRHGIEQIHEGLLADYRDTHGRNPDEPACGGYTRPRR